MMTTTPVPSIEDLLTGLNPEQYKAVVTPGSMLVLAGAGSGKTKVLSSRIAYNIKKGVDQNDILAVTFTNKAAKEMKGRIATMLGEPPKDLWVGTFHSICNQMLRQFGMKIGINPDFHILDATDQQSLVKRILKDMNVTNDDLKIRQETLGGIVAQISKIKEHGGRLTNRKGDLVEEVYVKYVAACKKEGAMDFEDLLMKTNEALSANTAGMADYYRARFSHILVDEFQDTNPAQYKWLSLIKGESAELFAVGDDDQSIYAFRGADPQSMNKYLKNIASGNIIRLEQNYRSTGNILEAANGVISNNDNRIGKTLRTDQGQGEQVSLVEFHNDQQEAKFIARSIKDLLNSGVKHSEIAVLYRSNHQSASLEKKMLEMAVPYVIHGGTRFFERQEVKDVLAYIRMAFKPEDNSAFYRVINHPPRGLGAKSLQPIYEYAKLSEQSYMDVAMDQAHEGNEKIAQFTDLIMEFNMAMGKMSLPDFFEYVIEMSGLLKFYENEEDSENRLNNMMELVSLASRFEDELNIIPESAREIMGSFLSTFTLEDAPAEERQQNRKKAVTLMTIHASKGLEFEHVFLNGVEDGSLPHKNALGEDGGLQEERRLMYVAITRAKKSLVASFSNNRYIFGKNEERDPSRFIEEIPESACRMRKFDLPDHAKKVQQGGGLAAFRKSGPRM
ncbi:ATP-dependent helicase [Methylobacillus sp. Pita2]|uniref:ATP-dependent helicase n=1 Tax=Methylobacillus sp. Pita2 TaxID=3383245 RepID=UPI0038B54091